MTTWMHRLLMLSIKCSVWEIRVSWARGACAATSSKQLSVTLRSATCFYYILVIRSLNVFARCRRRHWVC